MENARHPRAFSRSDLLGDLPRGQYEGFVGVPPNAHFEAPNNVLATESLRFNPNGNPESRRFLGVLGGETVDGPRLPDGRATRFVMGGTPIGVGDDRHHILIAGSRGNKGRSMIVPNLLGLPGSTSILSIDPKGDNARLTARWRGEGLRQSTVVLDPFGVSGSETTSYRACFNPLSFLDPLDANTFVPDAKLVADSLIVSGDYQNRHWDETAKQFLCGIILHVLAHTRYEGHRNLVTVWHLISEAAVASADDSRRYWLELEMLASDAASGAVRVAARGFYDRTGGEFTSVLSNLRKHIDWIGIECMAASLQGDSIDLRDLKRSSLALYVSLPAMRMGDLSGWLRLIVQLSLAAHEAEREQLGANTVMMLDEFNVLQNMQCIASAAGQIAGLGVTLVPVLQDLQQLQSCYPKSWETFLANAGVFQCYSIADQTTSEYVSKRLGQAGTLSRSTNAPSFDQAIQQAATGESWSLGVHPLLNAEEVCRYFGRDDRMQRQLILRPGYRPMICQRVCYDQHELFRDKYDRGTPC